MPENAPRIKTPLSKLLFSKIGVKLAVPYILLSLLAVVTISDLIYNNYQTRVESIKSTQKEISVRASTEVNFYVDSILKVVSLARKDVFCVDCKNSKENDRILKNLLDENPSISDVSIVNAQGQEINKADRYDPEVSSYLENIFSKEKFREAMDGKTYIGKVSLSKYDLPSLTVSLPIIDKDNRKIGVMIAEIDLSPMWDVISKISVGTSGYVYVVDPQGNLIVYKDIAFLKNNANIIGVTGVKNFINKIEGTSVYTSFTNQKVIGTWALAEIPSWGVIVELPYKEVLDKVYPLIMVSGFFVLVFLISTVIFLITIFKKLLLPINKLELGVSAIKEGAWETRIDIDSNDELGDLAGAFNQMSGNLKDLYGNLEQKVKERTDELAVSQDGLKKKVEDLKEMNSLMINRELKMIELKEEIEKLKKAK